MKYKVEAMMIWDKFQHSGIVCVGDRHKCDSYVANYSDLASVSSISLSVSELENNVGILEEEFEINLQEWKNHFAEWLLNFANGLKHMPRDKNLLIHLPDGSIRIVKSC